MKKMNRRLLIEILSAHADQLRTDYNAKSAYLAGFPQHRETLEPLLTTAEQTKRVLSPTKPSPAFRQDLRRSLLSAAAQQSRSPYQPAKSGRLPIRRLAGAVLNHVNKASTRVLVAATAGSAISAVSLIAFLLRSRASHGSQPVGLI